ncbi:MULTISPECIES: ABC transporter substrate-binding protein [Mycobacteriaceae]|uniref:ABC transporter substrate-binding protein n=1 Tax=Mycolicibacterium parafortuitum TaxID=39692 RepID=A0ACC6MFR3_MYCPF|nr:MULTISPECIES: ABC transporter substrate-binding protein [Mycobacteriaceae]MDZ5085446.1 ABC transporter substrate-binding protein [Mycolicibacterium parafortuitum]GFM17064.1 extracellular solute-binding protein family 1 [Mycobacterium sp. PO1]GFM25200.1 extracellular solute-binding protein family 1 [Mycobacterium sp. PO2]
MIRRRLCVALLAVVTLVLAACGGGGSSSGPTEIAVWHGYQDTEGEVFKKLIAQYNQDHPDVKVNELYSSNDLVLQKVLTAVRGGSAPDVAYMFGSWSPNIAQIPQVVDMAEYVSEPDWQWDDFYPAEREAATVGEKIVGVPALVDNLAIVYNKQLFTDAGVAPPSPDWTWADFRAAAAKLTDPAKGQYGWLIPADGSEDTVWHYLPMLWEAGGDILSPDNETAVFNSEAGVQALTVLQQMAVTDKSLYLDTTNENGPKLMNSGKVAMLVTGPWDLSQLPDIDYDVQVMPTFAGSSGGHQTIAGPDNWVVFDNGDEKKQAAVDFVAWLSAPEQVKTFSLGTGDLPIRQSVGNDQAVLDTLNENVPGTATFVENLNNVKKVRPTVEQYPDISDALGQAIVAVMLGKEQPADALNKAAQAADAALAEK